MRIGGFAGVAENVCYRLPSVEFTLEGIPFTLRDIDVLPSGSAGATAGSEAGSLGTDFATAFDTLTVDYTSCTVRGEKRPVTATAATGDGRSARDSDTFLRRYRYAGCAFFS